MNNVASHTLSSTADSTMRTDWLEFDASKTAMFCGEPDVYLVVQTGILISSPPTDPENRNDKLVKKINFKCDKGESFLCTSSRLCGHNERGYNPQRGKVSPKI